MKIIQIVYYTLLMQIRDKQSLAMMLLMPIALILLLGIALESDFQPPEMDAIKVAIYNEDKGEKANTFEEFLISDEVKGLLDVTRVSSPEEGRKLIEERIVWALISKERSVEGEGSNINILFIEGDNQSILTNIVGAYVDQENAVNALGKIGACEHEITRRIFVCDTAITVGGAKARAIDYFAVTMLAMTLMFGSVYAAEIVVRLKNTYVGKRAKSTLTKQNQIFAGATIASFILVLAQGSIILFFTKYVYNVNWGENIFVSMLIIFAMTLVSTSMGTLVGVLLADVKRVDLVINIFCISFYFCCRRLYAFGRFRWDARAIARDVT